MRLKDCFKEDFTSWLVKSNHPKIVQVDFSDSNFVSLEYPHNLNLVEEESLQEILDILLIHPEADYFWYTYPENGSGLTWALPYHEVVPSNGIRVDGDKIKMFLRNYKIEKLLQ
jgi:hypothetical protein